MFLEFFSHYCIYWHLFQNDDNPPLKLKEIIISGPIWMQPYSLQSVMFKTGGFDAALMAGLTYQPMTSVFDDMGISLNLLTHFTPEPSQTFMSPVKCLSAGSFSSLKRGQQGIRCDFGNFLFLLFLHTRRFRNQTNSVYPHPDSNTSGRQVSSIWLLG